MMKKSLKLARGLREPSLDDESYFEDRSGIERDPFANRSEKESIDPSRDLSREALGNNSSNKFFSSAISKAAGSLASNGVQAKRATSGNSGVKDDEIGEIDLSGGAPIPSSARTELESSMGYDFSDVRVHNDRHAENAAKSIDADAFTIGKNIAFDNGKYHLESSQGRRLIAHELVHVVHQGGARATSGEAQSVGGVASKGTAQRGKNVVEGEAPKRKPPKTRAYWKANPQLLAHRAASTYLKDYFIHSGHLKNQAPLTVRKKSKLQRSMKYRFLTTLLNKGNTGADKVEIEVEVFNKKGAIGLFGANVANPDSTIDVMGTIEDSQNNLYPGPSNIYHWNAPPLTLQLYSSVP